MKKINAKSKQAAWLDERNYSVDYVCDKAGSLCEKMGIVDDEDTNGSFEHLSDDWFMVHEQLWAIIKDFAEWPKNHK